MSDGWRLAVEPVEDGLAWSLLLDDGNGPRIVDARYEPNARSLRSTALRTLPQSGVSDLWGSALARPASERALTGLLGHELLPALLREALLAAPRRGTRPLLTLAVRGWAALVPWPALHLSVERRIRLVDRARVAVEVPPVLLSSRARSASEGDGEGLAVVDPGPVSGLPPPLYPGGYPRALREAPEFAEREQVGPNGAGASVRQIAGLLESRSWSRFLFVGHIRAGTDAAPAHAGLACSSGGRAEWLSAHDWIANPGMWPMPARVALVGCASGDSVPREQSGLILAAVNAGAHVVTSTRWPLPVASPEGDPLTELVLAVQRVQRSARPVEELRAWQAHRAREWDATGALAASPLLWAALSVSVAQAGPDDAGAPPVPAAHVGVDRG